MPMPKKEKVVPMTPATVAAYRNGTQSISLVGTVGVKVDTPSKAHEAGAALRDLPRTLMGGTLAMRTAADKYMPRHPAETPESYAVRLNGTSLYNAFSEAVMRQSSRFFNEPVGLNEDVPPALQRCAENIDGQGRALTPFCMDWAREAFIDGVSFALVDFPNIASGATMADQRRIGAQPYWVLVKANDLIGWRSENRAGKQILTQVRILETTTVPDGEFGEKVVQRVRVLEPGLWRVYEKQFNATQNAHEWVVTDEGPTSLPYIPLVPFYVNRTGFFEGSPPLRTLAEMNQEHWCSSSEQRRALTFLRFAMLKVVGVTEETTIKIGPDRTLFLPAGAEAGYVEHTGAGINAGAADLLAIETRMQHAGMELRVENAGAVTATAAAIDSDDSNAVLRAVAKALEDSIEQALQMSADYLCLPSGGTVEIADAFSGNEVPGTVLDLTSLRNSGALSLPTMWNELKRRQVLSEDFDGETELVLIQDEASFFAGMQQQNAPPQDQGGPPPQDQGAGGGGAAP